MFFVKVPVESIVAGIIAIRPDNTFFCCVKCGRAFRINLEEYARYGRFNLNEDSLLCGRCLEMEEAMMEAGNNSEWDFPEDDTDDDDWEDDEDDE